VDIIICVHNALKDVKSCLDSLLVSTSQPYHLILVDDGSDKATEQYLREFSQSHPSLLLRSEDATGYTYAANRGMRASSAEFVVLLNSDTILTPKWLDLCIACIQSDEKIGIVGPLSNTASWQSVPKIEQNGDWATNPLPDGVTPAHMAHLIATYSGRLYPEIPLLNGFCLIIRRSLLENVGLFDEEHFGKGYGEEDDLVLRARKSGWKMALADDVYIYHSQSKSYSSEKRHVLAERAGKILREKHGVKVITQSVHYCQYNRILEGIRARAQVAHQRDQFIQRGKQFAGKKILFVLPIVYSPNGGVNVIKTESVAMQAMGAQISYFHRLYHRDSFIESYPDLLSSSIFGEPEDLNSIAKDYDLVIATYNPTVAWMKSLARVKGHPELGYYIQGFEPWMYPAGSNAYKTARDSYTAIDDMTLFTKTDWTSQQVRQATGREAIVIGASLDIDLFRPRARTTANWPEGPLRIAAMIRPESPYREPLKTMKLLGQISQEYSAEIEIDLFGTDYDNSSFQELPQEFPFKFYGTLKPEQVANLFSQIDIFVDYSSQQAMGLTAMEAMACGCAVIVPQFGGASSYAVDEHNSLIVDTSSYENVRIAVRRLIKEEKLRNYLRKNAIYDICSFFPEKAAWNLLQAMTRF
jgi:GT2 family glycosyltransferase